MLLLRKYSPISELGDFAKEYAEALYDSLGNPILICDRDMYITTAGCSKQKYMDKEVSDTVKEMMENRKSILNIHKESISLTSILKKTKIPAYYGIPLILFWQSHRKKKSRMSVFSLGILHFFYYCSNCLPMNLAAVSSAFNSTAPTLAFFENITMFPTASPFAMIGEATYDLTSSSVPSIRKPSDKSQKSLGFVYRLGDII